VAARASQDALRWLRAGAAVMGVTEFAALGMTRESVVLVINTEGVTDGGAFRDAIKHGL